MWRVRASREGWQSRPGDHKEPFSAVQVWLAPGDAPAPAHTSAEPCLRRRLPLPRPPPQTTSGAVEVTNYKERSKGKDLVEADIVLGERRAG